MEAAIAIVIVAAVAAFVAVPFRASADGGPDVVETDDPVLADLEARKEAKYREIRDTELDHAQGKLGEAEFARQNAELRADAIEILRRIDEHGATAAPEAVEGRAAAEESDRA